MDNIDESSVKLPNFLIVGAGKSGTTSLWYYLKQHPEIFMPDSKELRFLASGKLIKNNDVTYSFQNLCDCSPINSMDNYISMFSNAINEKAIGEASPQYLYTYKNTIPVIQEYLGNPKIIIILRNPVDRAFSAYKHSMRGDVQSSYKARSFEEGLELEEVRKSQEGLNILYLYKSAGFYFNQVKAYIDNFKNVKIILYEDLIIKPTSLIKELYKFLDVDHNFEPDLSVKQNISPPSRTLFQRYLFSESKRKMIAPLLFKLIGEKKAMRFYSFIVDLYEHEQIKPETKKYLKELYRNDIMKLQSLIDRDLSHWLQ